MTYVYRYNPASTTGRATRVRSDSPEATDWPSRRPKVIPAAVRREIQRTGAELAKAAVGAAPVVVAAGKRALPVVGAAVLSASYLAAAGAISYAATRAVIEGQQEGDTVENSVAKARSMAVTAFHRQLGRFPTREEYTDLRNRIGAGVSDMVKAQLGSIPARWRLFLSLFKGG